MAILTLNGTEVKVTDFRDGAPIEIGERLRAVDGTLLDSVRARKQTWSGETTELSPADYTTVRNLIESTSSVTAAGDYFASSKTVKGRVTGVTPIYDGSTLRKTISFELEEA